MLVPKWVEESFTNFGKGINWRSYVVCDVAYNNVNNWLWSPFIDRGSANRLYIEIQFTIRDCSLFPGNALSCKETFSLLFYEFDAATREPPPWQPESYKLIGKQFTLCYHVYAGRAHSRAYCYGESRTSVRLTGSKIAIFRTMAQIANGFCFARNNDNN